MRASLEKSEGLRENLGACSHPGPSRWRPRARGTVLVPPDFHLWLPGQDRNAVPGMRTQDLEHRRVPNTPQLHQAKVGTQHPSFVGYGEGQPMVLALHFPKASESQTPPERGADSGR